MSDMFGREKQRMRQEVERTFSDHRDREAAKKWCEQRLAELTAKQDAEVDALRTEALEEMHWPSVRAFRRGPCRACGHGEAKPALVGDREAWAYYTGPSQGRVGWRTDVVDTTDYVASAIAGSVHEAQTFGKWKGCLFRDVIHQVHIGSYRPWWAEGVGIPIRMPFLRWTCDDCGHSWFTETMEPVA